LPPCHQTEAVARHYSGSDNAHTVSLNHLGMQEFGFLVSGENETRMLLDGYWAKPDFIFHFF